MYVAVFMRVFAKINMVSVIIIYWNQYCIYLLFIQVFGKTSTPFVIIIIILFYIFLYLYSTLPIWSWNLYVESEIKVYYYYYD